MPRKPKRPCSFPGCPKLTEGRFCEECQKKGLLRPVEEVHHKLPLAEGGTHDEENLVSLCQPCHARIHAERGDRWNKR